MLVNQLNTALWKMRDEQKTYPGKWILGGLGCHTCGECQERFEVPRLAIWLEGGSQVSTNILLRWSPCPCCPHWYSIGSMGSLRHSCWPPRRASSGRHHIQHLRTIPPFLKLREDSSRGQLPAEDSCWQFLKDSEEVNDGGDTGKLRAGDEESQWAELNI